MEKYVDLHCHSIYSDGKHTVKELVEMAKDNNVDFFSVTDHDNIDSINETKKHKNDSLLTIVNGVELSTVINYDGKDVYMHILGYNFNPENRELLDELARYKNVLCENNMQFFKDMLLNIKDVPDCIIRSFNMYDYRLSYQQIRDILLSNKYNEEYIDVFINRIKEYTPKYYGYEMDAKKAIDLIRSSGGISILAHPNKIKVDSSNIERLISVLTYNGLNGIETSHSFFKSSDFDFYRKIAVEKNLLESVGSDYHFDTNTDRIIIGHGINNNICQENCSVKSYLLRKGIR